MTFNTVIFDFGGVITSSPFEAFNRMEAERGLPKDFVRRLRRNARGKAPVVFLYAETADTELIGQSILQGAADVLMKPFDRDILQFKLRQAGIVA